MGVGESGLVGDFVIRIGRFAVETALDARPGLGTQFRYEAPGDRRVEIVKTQWLTSSWSSCLLENGPKLAVGQPNNSGKKFKKIKSTLKNIKATTGAVLEKGCSGKIFEKLPMKKKFFLVKLQASNLQLYWIWTLSQCLSRISTVVFRTSIIQNRFQ